MVWGLYGVRVLYIVVNPQHLRERQIGFTISYMIGALALLAVSSVAKTDLSAVKAPPGPIRTGQGDFIYEYQPSLLQVPPSPKSGGQNVLNGHGIARDKEGYIYFTFQPTNVAEDTQVLVKFNPDGTKGVLLGDKGPTGLSQGVPHGLRLEHDETLGQDFLYHANNAALVFKTDTDGKVVYKIDLNHWEQDHKAFWPCKPTDATVVGDTLYVSDGYGTSWIHMFNKHNGTYISSFGGAGKTSADPVKFHTPHSLKPKSCIIRYMAAHCLRSCHSYFDTKICLKSCVWLDNVVAVRKK